MVMAGSGSDEYLLPGGSSHMDGLSSMQHCQSVESLAEWRSCDQVENGVPSTSPPYWDSDDGEDSGPKPSDLFVKFTWKIENFSQTSKRELKSNVFEIGGYKWYILVYPQGCDVCNHLSLFLCVANHDKLLPGWSHFAQFTITVLNKDPKKNKYSDTLHRFWKKEHDWGWKKFMELTKVMDGFVVDDGSLTIKAQVQVIREKAHRPFRCLDCQYRREIIRVYLSNVEQTYAHFVQERRKKLQDLLNDKAKWSSFHAFWLGIDQATRRCMSRDKTEVILKVIVKHFFIEKEVSSTLIMDSLYTGLKALESQSKLEKVRTNLLEKEELQAPFIFIENDMFVLADDVFLLLERAASELPHPPLPAKEEKGVPNRTKDGCSGEEFNRESILRDERRLTELGRRTLEIFVLAHIFSSKIEIAYQEAVALKRQEELIREEAAEQAENVMRERRTKKKQAKQRRNNRKGKDRGKSEKSVEIFNEKNQPLNSPAERVSDDFSSDQTLQVNGKNDPKGDVSDVSDSAEALQPDIEGRDTGTLSWDTDTSEVHPRAVVIASEVQNGHMDKKSSTVMDDSSSTCSTDSVPSVVVNTQSKGNSSPNNKKKRTSNRGKKQRNKDIRTCSIPKTNQIPFASGTCRAAGPEPEVSIHALKDQIQKFEQLVEKEEVDVTHGNELIDSDPVDIDQEVRSKSDAVEPSSSSSEPSIEPLTVAAKNEQVSTSELTSNNPTTKSEQPVLVAVKSPQKPTISNPVALKHHSEATTSSASSMSRPSSTPLVPSQKPTVPVVSSSQTLPTLLQTLSSINCSDTKPSPFAQSFEPQSYRNAIMGIKTATSQSELGQPSSSSIFRPPSSLSMSSINGQTSRNIGFFGSHCRANDNTLSSRQSQGVMPDEFPHLDIINDLLDEDQMVGRAAISGYDHYHDDYPMNQQYTFPQDSCQFELPEYYYNEISQMVSFMPFHGLSDFSIYGNGMDAILQNYWPTDDADLSMMNFGCPMDVNGYGYQLPDYSPCGVNGYNMMYQPANGP